MKKFIITESEKKRILGLHNKYINKPQTWVIKEAFTGTAGDGYDGDVEACKKDLPFNVAVKTGQVSSSADWRKLRQEWGSDGSMTQNLKMRDEMCDGWRSGDKFPEEESSESETSDQTKKEWLDKQVVNYPSITDKKRFELFTKIPNYNQAELLNIRYAHDVPDGEMKKYYPKSDNFLVWFSDNNLVAFRDNKKEDLKMYLENGNIVSKSPNLNSRGERDYKYLGTW